MKYNELHKLLRRIGCYPLDQQMAGHPVWYSPLTQKKFTTSNHGNHEVATGTLRSIKKISGLI
ncbi:MAG: type II toxin-antitoxin system HicA family toxin [Paludibacteraceae bacterium]|nr:type II toxin-antitoxin system HicA family toxin [Paludibacteraceae bacterium]